MTSCVACTEGITPSGSNCPNGCNQNVYCDPEAPVCVEYPTCKGEGGVEVGDFIVKCKRCRGAGCLPAGKDAA